MFKTLIVACLLLAANADVLRDNRAYIGSPIVYARPAGVVPLVYTRPVHAAAVPAIETYNSVQTPDSFQQQYRTDYKPLAYEYIY